MLFRLLVLVTCVYWQGCPALAQRTYALAKADQRVKSKLNGFPGKVTLYAKNLQTRLSYGIMPDQPVRTASTIKLAIMIESFSEVAEGKLKWSDPIKIVEDEKVSGS